MKKLFALMMVASLAAIGCEDKKSTGTKPTEHKTAAEHTAKPPETSKPAEHTTKPEHMTKTGEGTTKKTESTKKSDKKP